MNWRGTWSAQIEVPLVNTEIIMQDRYMMLLRQQFNNSRGLCLQHHVIHMVTIVILKDPIKACHPRNNSKLGTMNKFRPGTVYWGFASSWANLLFFSSCRKWYFQVLPMFMLTLSYSMEDNVQYCFLERFFWKHSIHCWWYLTTFRIKAWWISQINCL